MFFIKKFKTLASLCCVIAFAILIIVNPLACKEGAFNGILICGRIIIPSLFPFTVCVLFIIKSGLTGKLDFLSPLTQKIFGINGEKFSLFILSLIGGYPVGAKLIKETHNNGSITDKEAGIMLNFCINAGPAFIIGAVGTGIMNSKKIGYFLFLSHIISSVMICILSRFIKTETKASQKKLFKSISFSDNLVLSTAEASGSVLNICSFVILFSTVNAYIEALYQSYPPLKYLLLLSEVTNALLYTDNIYLISFLLGFGGFCVWCQVMSFIKGIRLNYPVFFLFRLLHGILSALFTKIFLRIFGVGLPTFSSGGDFSFRALYSTPALTFSMLVMSIIFMISISAKKYSAKILEDIV